MHCDCDGPKGARGEGNVLRFEVETKLRAHLLGQKRLGLGLAGLVGVPILVLRHGPGLDRLDNAWQRKLMGVPEGEVTDFGIAAAHAIA